MTRLLVTGASGFLGGEVAERAVRAGRTVAGTCHTTSPAREVFLRGDAVAVRLDVRDAEAVARVVDDVRPDAVVHCAYVQDGPAAEATIVEGSRHVAAAARAVGARLVHLSSDVVFAGDLGRPLREDDPPAPVFPYGAAKARAEEEVAAADPGAVLVRTSLVFGGPGAERSKHEALAIAVARGEREMAFFTDEVRCPVQVGDLAAAVLELAARPGVAGPLHVAGTEAVDRLTFARLACEAAGVDASGLRGAPSPPGRPRDCALDVSRALALLETPLRGVSEVLRRTS
ncbi:sugar nucleotide-binding protein [Conexibacter sp. SYSU D00693]|uniref:SDR family oxidoreductase n=1 Tax=Conexibacter sp. SYSU D00693 TaxID=2812560 RepID=UPI00196AC46B|nr:sugar nucleotide-binding protein [Conexibacter sp. SYSU D00693]